MKINLARLHSRDFYKLKNIISDDIAEQASLPVPFTRDAISTFINDYNTWGVWINGGVLAGAIEIRDTNEVAYLISKQFQNKGIATRAVILAKEQFADKQLWCYVNPHNVASLRVAQKANMRIQYYNE